jgi:NADH-quinone oxidoreductase E subunit
VSDSKRGGPDRNVPFRNPGWAGNTGEYELSEAEVRGEEYVGIRSKDGGHPSISTTMPYILDEKSPDAPLFEGEYRERLDKIRSRYPDLRGALIPVLNLAQEIRGHLTSETMKEVAAELELSDAYVRGVATFYTMYNKAPVGRFLIQVCTNISCNLCGGDEVLAAFLKHAGVEMGETTDDGLFTITEVECLAACGFPTAVQINSRYYENVQPEDVPALLDRLREEGA